LRAQAQGQVGLAGNARDGEPVARRTDTDCRQDESDGARVFARATRRSSRIAMHCVDHSDVMLRSTGSGASTASVVAAGRSSGPKSSVTISVENIASMAHRGTDASRTRRRQRRASSRMRARSASSIASAGNNAVARTAVTM
jgi:hypothetical protein